MWLLNQICLRDIITCAGICSMPPSNSSYVKIKLDTWQNYFCNEQRVDNLVLKHPTFACCVCVIHVYCCCKFCPFDWKMIHACTDKNFHLECL